MKKIIFTVSIFFAINSIAQDSILDEVLDNNRPNDKILNADVVADADTAWTDGGLLGFNTSQTFLNNWAAGGQSSVSGTAFLNLYKNYAEGSWAWDNNLSLSYGLLNNGIDSGKTVKIDDKIDFRSKAGKQAFDNWYYSAEVSFLSQFAPGYLIVDGSEDKESKISDLFAPAFLSGGIGMTYKPNDNFNLSINPLATKNTIVNGANSNLRENYGFEDLSSSIRSEFGGSLGLGYRTALAENAEYQTNLLLFSNYLDNPGNVDVNWENILAMKLAKYFNINLIMQFVYDDDIQIQKVVNGADGNPIMIDPDGEPGTGDETELTRGVSTMQFREVFGIGFSYKF